MSVSVRRRPEAVKDAEEIADYIARDSLDAALRFLENTEATLRFLAEHPRVGSPFMSENPDLAKLRTCRVKGFPNHIVFYVEHQAAIEVVRIIHGARNIGEQLRQS